MDELSETVAVVTGASRGVGRGVAEALGDAGATVYVTGRSVDGDTTEGLPGAVAGTAEAVSERGGYGVAVACDHTDDAAVERLFDRVRDDAGRLDLLVNNVRGGYERYDESFGDPFWRQPVARWDRMFDAGVRAHFTASRLAVPMLLETAGLIVTISSGDGEKYRGSVPYDVAKAADERLAKGMAHELRDDAVASVALQPGFVRTERVEAAFDAADEDVPGETHSPVYVGRAVVALATDADVLARSGRVLRVGDLARDYGFTDVDGTQPPAFDLDAESP